MSLIVEDGSGVSGAESYTSVADADTYHTNHGDPTTWDGASDAVKETALRMATLYVDLTYGSSFTGRKADADYSLEWPRTNVQDQNGYAVDADFIPFDLMDGVSYAALKHIEDGTLFPDTAVDAANITKTFTKIGPIATLKEFAGSKASKKRYPLIDLYMRTLTLSSGAQVERG